MRGEHGNTVMVTLDPKGSSPHARGAPLRTRVRPRPSRDHPRMRGEHDPMEYGWVLSSGSSPHARGAPQDGPNRPADPGIIPACAESTRWRSRASTSTGDHPRMRGEHDSLGIPWTNQKGSSPHARGARAGDGLTYGLLGIIPACAGSTCRRRSDLRLARDHPRMRGEHVPETV